MDDIRLTMSAYHLNNKSTLRVVWAIKHLNVTSFNRSIFVPEIIDAAFENRQQRLLSVIVSMNERFLG